jgi:hypothetical protein
VGLLGLKASLSGATFSGTVNLSNLTASTMLQLDSSKNIVSSNTLSTSLNADNRFTVSNPNTGVAATAGIRTSADVGGTILQTLSSNYAGTYAGVALAGLSYIGSESSNSGLFITQDGAKPIYLATNGVIRQTINSAGNIGIGTTTFETSQVGGLSIKQGTDATTNSADQISIYSTAGANSTLGFCTEQAVATAAETSDRTLTVKINGALYKMLLTYISG